MRDVPFDIRRVYFVHRIVADRGGHAHLDTHQVVVAISGHCDMMLTDGTDECVHRLDRVTRGLYIPPMLFIRMTAFAPDTVLASFASTHYDASRSLRSWDAYLRAIGR